MNWLEILCIIFDEIDYLKFLQFSLLNTVVQISFLNIRLKAKLEDFKKHSKNTV